MGKVILSSSLFTSGLLLAVSLGAFMAKTIFDDARESIRDFRTYKEAQLSRNAEFESFISTSSKRFESIDKKLDLIIASNKR